MCIYLDVFVSFIFILGGQLFLLMMSSDSTVSFHTDDLSDEDVWLVHSEKMGLE